MNSDFAELLSLFDRFDVRYLMVGGYAVMLYAEPRYTKDIDLVIGTGPGEVDRFAAALAEFGFPMTPEQLDEFRLPNKMISLGVPPNRIDLLSQIDGIDFDSAWANRNTVEIGGLSVSVISREDLIAAKRASGRPQDLIDLKSLVDE